MYLHCFANSVTVFTKRTFANADASLDRDECLQDQQIYYVSIVNIHTIPDPTPIATVVPRTDEHDGRYSDNTQSMFLLAWLTHVLSELRLVPRY